MAETEAEVYAGEVARGATEAAVSGGVAVLGERSKFGGRWGGLE